MPIYQACRGLVPGFQLQAQQRDTLQTSLAASEQVGRPAS